jgi:hypothetical protein
MRRTSQPPLRGLSQYSACFSNLFLVACTLGLCQFSAGCASVSAGKESSAARISIVPASVNFKEVVVGQKNSQTLQISNTSKDPISFEALRVTGSGFRLSPVKTPLTLPGGKSFRVTLVFSPTKESASAGSLAISSADLEGPVSVPLAGYGEKAAPQLQSHPASLNFGTVAVRTTSTQTINLKNTGNVPLTINSAALSNSAFSTAGLSSGVSLAPGQTLEFKLVFRPTGNGTVSGTLSIGSSSLAAPVRLAVSGAGASATTPTPSPVPGHSVSLAWDASSSSVAGYHVYRAGSSGGPYNRISGSIVSSLAYQDDSVQSGDRYYYVVTAVEAHGSESAYSNEVAVEIPGS